MDPQDHQRYDPHQQAFAPYAAAHIQTQQPATTMFLPEYWTPTDQVIMEDLLLSHDVPQLSINTSPPAASSCRSSAAATRSSSMTTPRDPTAPLAALSIQSQAKPSISSKRSVSHSAMSSPSSCSGSGASTPSATAMSGSQTSSRPHSRVSSTAKVTDEERRARHRAVQKRFVQRKKAAVAQIKQRVAALETQFALLQAASEAQHLAAENDALTAQCIATEARAAAAAIDDDDPLAAFTKQIELVREFFVPLTPAQYASMLERNVSEYDAARRDASTYQTSGLTVMGWHDQRKIDDASIKFVLSKEFVNVRAASLMSATWQQLRDPATHAQFFSPAFVSRVHVLQTLNDDAVVLHRALYNPLTGGIVHGLDLLCRIERDGAFVIFESAIDANAVVACLRATHHWSHVTVSHVFAPAVSSTGVESCVFRHGGILRHFALASVRFWLMEMFFIALRYESAMVAPVFSLTAE